MNCIFVSSIVFEAIRTILSLFFFLWKDFKCKKKHQNAKQTIFTLLEVFVWEKLLPLLFFVRLILFC